MAPAPLDNISVLNGVSKFIHPQALLTPEQETYCLSYLNQWFPDLGRFCTVATDEEVLQNVFDHKEKAAGFPWNSRGMALKGNVLDKVGLKQIEDHYREFSSVISCTLKDEMRDVGKDARLFRPQDVSSYIEGCRLFLHMNHYLTIAHRSPIFNRYVSPGQDIPRIYQKLQRDFPNSCFGADGSQWDAHYPTCVANIVRAFRRQFLPPERVDRYYAQMYCGYTNVLGNLMALEGNPSGHFNTSTDNSLCHMILIALCFFDMGIPYDQIDHYITYFCCGDDLLYGTEDARLYPEELWKRYRSYGVTLEFEFLEPKPAYALQFVGMTPKWKELRGSQRLLYHMRPKKAHASASCTVKNRTPLDNLAKLASICQLTFADDELYRGFVQLFQTALSQYISQGILHGTEQAVHGLMQSISERRLTLQYMEWETDRECEASL